MEGSRKSVVAGLTTILVIGTIIGLIAPKNLLLTPPYRSISAAIGYIYFMAWSISFYPQTFSNFKRQRTDGLSVDFCFLNVLGFGCYTAYNGSFFWSKTIEEEYKRRYPGAEILVQSNDLAFAIHALLMSSITLFQIVYYDGIRSVKLKKPILSAVILIFGICGIYPILIVVDSYRGKYDNDSMHTFNWLNYLYLLSYCKIFISLIKYIPQVILNYRRKSTVGWSIWNILLDFTGGVLSDLQLVLDCINLHDFRAITRNLAKFGLGWLSIIFDLIFLFQHYFLYNHRDNNDSSLDGDVTQGNQTEPLLPPAESDIADESMENASDQGEEESTFTAPQPEMIFV